MNLPPDRVVVTMVFASLIQTCAAMILLMLFARMSDFERKIAVRHSAVEAVSRCQNAFGDERLIVNLEKGMPRCNVLGNRDRAVHAICNVLAATIKQSVNGDPVCFSITAKET